MKYSGYSGCQKKVELSTDAYQSKLYIIDTGFMIPDTGSRHRYALSIDKNMKGCPNIANSPLQFGVYDDCQNKVTLFAVNQFS